MPQTLVLEGLSVETEPVLKDIPRRDHPGKTIKVPLPRRILRMDLSGRLRPDTDKAIERFLKSLRTSPLLSPVVDNIRMVSQGADEKKAVMHYVVECVFEPK